MITLENIILNYKIGREDTSSRSEREEILTKFIKKLNEARTLSGYRPLRSAFYAVKMANAGLKTTSDLYWFYRYCEDANDFSKCWWWSLNSKNAKK